MTIAEQHQRSGSAVRWLKAKGAMTIGAMLVTAGIGTPAAQAQTQTYTVLHRFHGAPTDAARASFGAPIKDSPGNLYGSTFYGGISNSGAVFELDKAGETVLYSFTGGVDGANPNAGLVRDSAGDLYGTTSAGGSNGGCGESCGVVFKLDPTGTETVLHSFTGGADGGNPYAGLVRDPEGNLYCTTAIGGLGHCPAGCGVVFKLVPPGRRPCCTSSQEEPMGNTRMPV